MHDLAANKIKQHQGLAFKPDWLCDGEMMDPSVNIHVNEITNFVCESTDHKGTAEKNTLDQRMISDNLIRQFKGQYHASQAGWLDPTPIVACAWGALKSGARNSTWP